MKLGRTTEEVLEMETRFFTNGSVPRISKNELWTSIIDKVKGSAEHTVLVVDETNRLVGLITDQDIIRALPSSEEEQVTLNKMTAENVIASSKAGEKDIVVRSLDSLEDTIAKLQGRNSRGKPFKALPVVDESGAPTGLVTRKSIKANLDALLEE